MADLQWLKLERAGLAPYFDAFVASAAVGIGKPDARIFTVALERLGCTPQATWMVGDSLHRDVAGARAAGVRAVWLDRRGEDADGVEADCRIRSLAELAW
jgi:putative hydrolase of the HAD superfamily